MDFQLLGRLQLRVRYILLLFVCWGLGALPAESAPPLPQEDWFCLPHYKAAAETIRKHFNSLNTGPILNVPRETRTWPVAGDPEYGHLPTRTQVLMSHMFRDTDLEGHDVKNPMTPGVHRVHDSPGSAMWLTVQGEFRDYMLKRSEQWDPSITDYKSASSRSIYNRGAAALGMYNDAKKPDSPAFGYFPYVADLWIDANSLFRTGLYQKTNDPRSAAPKEPYDLSLGNWAGNEDHEPWLNEWANINPFAMELARGASPEDLATDTGNANTYASWYNDWWRQNTDTATFPWTGHGYTYDWAYLDNYEDAQGLAEFVVMPSGGGENKHTFYYEVISYHKTLEYVIVPEPSSLMLVILGLVLVPLKMHRR